MIPTTRSPERTGMRRIPLVAIIVTTSSAGVSGAHERTIGLAMSATDIWAGSFPAAMIFSRKSHSVTMPATSPEGRRTIAYPFRWAVKERAQESASAVLPTVRTCESMMSRASSTIAPAHPGRR